MRPATILSLLLAGAATLGAQHTHSLWVTLGDSDQLVEVDPHTFESLRRIKVDRGVHGLAITGDGTKVFVASDKTGMFQVVDARRGAVVGQIHIGNDPNQMTLSADERFAFVPMRGEASVTVVQLNPLRLVKKLPMDRGPHDAITSADGKRVWVGAQYGTSIAEIDVASQAVVRTIQTGAGVRPIKESADGRQLYVALSSLIGFVVVDLASGQVTRRVELGKLPDGVPVPYKETYTHDIELSPDGKELWLCDDVNDLIRVVRLSDMKELTQIRTGHFPHWFAMRDDGKVLFTSLWFSDAVAAIDIASRKVLKNIQFEYGAGPKRIAIARRVERAP